MASVALLLMNTWENLKVRGVLAKIYHVDDETMESVENLRGTPPQFRFEHIAPDFQLVGSYASTLSSNEHCIL